MQAIATLIPKCCDNVKHKYETEVDNLQIPQILDWKQHSAFQNRVKKNKDWGACRNAEPTPTNLEHYI